LRLSVLETSSYIKNSDFNIKNITLIPLEKKI
jgi:hypothetical protein